MPSESNEFVKPSLSAQMTRDQLNLLDQVEQERKSKPQPAPDKPEPPKEASTLLGKGIEFTWDKISGEAQTDKEKQDRAAKSDHYAEIAADTAASIPRVGMITGGLARGVLLSDVSGQVTPYDFGKKFVLDVAQGAALNRVGQIGQAAAERNALTGVTLSSELRTHFYSGAAFGGVKSAFNGDSYKDQYGNFSSLAAMRNIGTSMAVGGVVSMPAGYVGGRVGRASSVMLGEGAEQGAVQSLLRSTATGASSGFANGAVFGGIEGARHDMSISNILDSALEGGVVGALTGGALGGAERLRSGPVPRVEQSAPGRSSEAGPVLEIPSLREVAANEMAAQRAPAVVERPKPAALEHPPVPQEDIAPVKPDRYFEPGYETSTRGSGRRVPDLTPEQKLDNALYGPQARENFDALSFKPVDRAKISEVEPRLKVVGTEDRREFVMPPGISTKHEDIVALLDQKAKPGQKADHSDFFALLDYKQTQKRVYEVDGSETRIVVAEPYAKQLDEVRELRRAVDNATDTAAKSAASAKLAEHPQADRALPEDIVKILDILPQSHMIKTLELSGEPNVHDFYARYKYDDPTFAAAARVGPDGRLTLMQADINSTLTTYITHELSHLTRWNNTTNSRLFDKATAVDLVEVNVNHKESRLARETKPNADDVEAPGIYHPSEHAARNLDEGWAVAKGEELMHPDPDRMSYYARKAPVRTLVLSRAIEDGARETLAKGDAPVAQLMLERARLLEDAVKPVALKIMQDRAVNGSPQQRADAIELLSVYGNEKDHGDLLLKLATSPRTTNATDSSGRPLPGPDITQAAFDAMVKMHGGSDANKLDFAAQQAIAHPELRETAARAINKLKDPRAGFYRRILEFDGDASGVSDLYKHLPVGRNSDQTGREWMYREMMGALNQNKSKQIEWSLRIFDKVPSLRTAVSDHLSDMVRDGLNPTEREGLARGLEQESRRGVPEEDQRRIAAIFARLIQNDRVRPGDTASGADTTSRQLEEVAILGSEKNYRGVAPLIELAISGQKDIEAAARHALSKQSRGVIKHFVHQAKNTHKSDPDKVAKLNELLDWRNY